MPYLHQLNRISYPVWFIGVNCQRLTGCNCAKGAGTRANIPQYHKSGRTCTPAFTHIWAIATLANGVQFMLVNQAAHMSILLTYREFYPQPIRLALLLV